MKKYNLKVEDIPVAGIYDVIVVGGGTAGSFAAITAAQNGADTLLIERLGFLGGSSTAAQVVPMMHVKIPGNPSSSYLDKRMRKYMTDEGYAARDRYGNDGWFNPEMLKFVLEKQYNDAGGELRYDTEFIDTIIEDKEIKGVIVHNKEGLQVYLAKIFIDGTGDADLAYNSDVPCMKGRKKDGLNQAVSLRFMLGNIDLKKFQRFLKEIGQEIGLNYPLIETAMVWNNGYPIEKLFRKGVEKGVLREEDGNYFQAFSVPGMEGVMAFNCPEIPGVTNSLSIQELSQARVKGKEMIRRLYRFLVEYCPGFENSYIQESAPMVGIRESRRIKGRYILSVEDYNNRSKFEDAIAKTAYPIDVHGLSEDNLKVNHLDESEYFEIPYRALLPQNINNLLVIGRSISSTFVAQSAIRIQPTCRATGEAAGLAAVLSIDSEINVSDIDGRLVRKRMIEMGSEL